ncbi:MAG TPA: hypothetical protein VJ916_05490 [Anaerovoracaceae bacterium]|nr:hypothetical protein [Anaerovoracaceae bacterium]
MKLKLENVNYAKSIIISVFADGKYIERKRLDGEANLNKEKNPPLIFDLPKCNEVKVLFSKNKESMINEPRFFDYFIATIFTIFTIFIPKLFPEQYFLNRIVGDNTEILLKGEFDEDKELDVKLRDFTYKEPYLILVCQDENIEIVYDYNKHIEPLEEEWNKYTKMLLRYFLITLIISAILIIDTFMSIRAGYIGAFGVIMVPMAIINFLKLYTIGENQKRHFYNLFNKKEAK